MTVRELVDELNRLVVAEGMAWDTEVRFVQDYSLPECPLVTKAKASWKGCVYISGG